MGPGIITPPPRQKWEEPSQPSAVPRALRAACHLILQGRSTQSEHDHLCFAKGGVFGQQQTVNDRSVLAQSQTPGSRFTRLWGWILAILGGAADRQGWRILGIPQRGFHRSRVLVQGWTSCSIILRLPACPATDASSDPHQLCWGGRTWPGGRPKYFGQQASAFQQNR